MEERKNLDLKENKNDERREKRGSLTERITKWVNSIMPDRF